MSVFILLVFSETLGMVGPPSKCSSCLFHESSLSTSLTPCWSLKLIFVVSFVPLLRIYISSGTVLISHVILYTSDSQISVCIQSLVSLLKLQLQSRTTEGSPWFCFSVKFPSEPNSPAQRTTLTSKAGDIFTSVLILISLYSANYQAYQSLNLGPKRPWTFGPHR